MGDHISRLWILAHIILVVRLGQFEPAAFNPGSDRLLVPTRRPQLLEKSLSSLPLLRILRKNCRTISGTDIRTLPINLRWIVRDISEYLQQLAVAYLRRIEADLHCLGRIQAIGSRSSQAAWGPARISRNDIANAFYMLEHAFNAPKAAAGENRGFQSFRGNSWLLP